VGRDHGPDRRCHQVDGAARVSQPARSTSWPCRSSGRPPRQAESIQSGENLLLTFRSLKNGVGEGNDVFNQATVALVDMARALGKDPQDAAIQLGKALNDPITGMTALRRVGVSFTQDQQKLIKTLAESGDIMGAQKVILGS
jgi:hypothetical protein